MNVREMKEFLNNYPDDMPVVRIRDPRASVLRWDTMDGWNPLRVSIVKREFMGQTYYVDSDMAEGDDKPIIALEL